MKKLIITEDEKKRILGLYEIVGEKLTPQVLNSEKAKNTKNYAQFLNSHYKINLPAATTGSWTDKDYNDYLKKFMEENNIPVWVCKTGDGFCPDNSDGEITTKSNDLWEKFVKPFINKTQSPQTLTGQTSTGNFTKDLSTILNIDEYYLKFMELPIPTQDADGGQKYLKDRYTAITEKMRENATKDPNWGIKTINQLINFKPDQSKLEPLQKVFLNSLDTYLNKQNTSVSTVLNKNIKSGAVNLKQNPKEKETIKNQMNQYWSNISKEKLDSIKQTLDNFDKK